MATRLLQPSAPIGTVTSPATWDTHRPEPSTPLSSSYPKDSLGNLSKVALDFPHNRHACVFFLPRSICLRITFLFALFHRLLGAEMLRGQSWFPQNINARDSLEDIHMADQNTGYAVGSFVTIQRTIDGCARWEPAGS